MKLPMSSGYTVPIATVFAYERCEDTVFILRFANFAVAPKAGSVSPVEKKNFEPPHCVSLFEVSTSITSSSNLIRLHNSSAFFSSCRRCWTWFSTTLLNDIQMSFGLRP